VDAEELARHRLEPGPARQEEVTGVEVDEENVRAPLELFDQCGVETRAVDHDDRPRADAVLADDVVYRAHEECSAPRLGGGRDDDVDRL
jgi:hypothetical protein